MFVSTEISAMLMDKIYTVNWITLCFECGKAKVEITVKKKFGYMFRYGKIYHLKYR